MDYSYYYMESNLFCIAILTILFYKVSTAVDRQLKQIVYRDVLLLFMLYFVADIFSVMCESEGFLPTTNFSLTVTGIITHSIGSFCAYGLFLYLEFFQENKWTISREKKILASIPCVFNTIMIILTPVTHLYFHAENVVIVRDEFYMIMVLISAGYLIISGVHAAIKLFQNKEIEKHDLFRTAAIFPILPVASILLQIINAQVPFVCYGMTLALLLAYIGFADNAISQDALTHVNNRSELRRFLAAAVKIADSSHPLGLMMIDVDQFKNINDRFGHIEGDQALKKVAEVLKKCCSNENGMMVARYGGDEFVVAGSRNGDGLRRIEKKITDAFKDINESQQFSYEIAVSIGIAVYKKGTSSETLPGLIKEADENMYQCKNSKYN